MKEFKRTLGRYGLLLTSWLINKFPYSAVRGFIRFFVFFAYLITFKLKRISRESLQIAFNGSLSDNEINKITKRCYTTLGKGMIELIYFMEHPQRIKEHVSIIGRQYLDEAFARGNGVIAVSAHFGSFPLMLLHYAQEGYKTNAIIRRVRDDVMEDHFLKQRTRLGLKTIYAHPRVQCVNTAISCLRNNEMVFIPLDQNFGSAGGVFVDFFGQKAATATGPVVLARRTKAPIIPMFIIRQPDDTHKIIIEPPLALEEREEEKESIQVNIARITKLIETYIRKYPHEWGWMHRRWKTKPPPQEASNSQEAVNF